MVCCKAVGLWRRETTELGHGLWNSPLTYRYHHNKTHPREQKYLIIANQIVGYVYISIYAHMIKLTTFLSAVFLKSILFPLLLLLDLI